MERFQDRVAEIPRLLVPRGCGPGDLPGRSTFAAKLARRKRAHGREVKHGFADGPAEWRWKLGIPALPALFFLFMLFGIPRSPRWLVKKQRIAEARDGLRMTGEQDYEQELQEIIVSINAEHVTDDSLFSWKYRLPIFLAVSIGMFNQLSGINAILYYLNDIFAFAGFNKVSSDLHFRNLSASGCVLRRIPICFFLCHDGAPVFRGLICLSRKTGAP